jgi:hypothetical protein
VVLKISLSQSRRKDQAPNPATPFEQFNSVLDLPVICDVCRFILNGPVRNSALAGREGRPCLVAPKHARGPGPPKAPPGGGRKKTPATKSLSRTDNGNTLCSLSQSCRRGRFQKA